jgi:hypothetical protein
MKKIKDNGFQFKAGDKVTLPWSDEIFILNEYETPEDDDFPLNIYGPSYDDVCYEEFTRTG